MRVHRDGGGLARAHVGELCLLVVRDHPDVGHVHDGEQRLARLHGLAHLHRAARDAAGDGRGDRRVFEVQLGLAQRRARLGQLRLGARLLRAAHGHLAAPAAGVADRVLGLLALPARLRQHDLLRGHLRLGLGHLGVGDIEPLPRRLQRRASRLERVVRVVEVLTRDELALEQLGGAPAVEARAVEVRLARRDLGLRGLHGGRPRTQLAAALVERARGAVDAEHGPRRRRLGDADLAARGALGHGNAGGGRAQATLRGGQRRAGLVDLDLEIARVQPHERRARGHLLVVAHEQLEHGAAHARAHRRDVGLDEGVVGRDVAVPVPPEPDAVHGRAQGDDAEGDERIRASAPPPRVEAAEDVHTLDDAHGRAAFRSAR